MDLILLLLPLESDARRPQRRALHRYRQIQRCQTSPALPSIPITGRPLPAVQFNQVSTRSPIDRSSCRTSILCDLAETFRFRIRKISLPMSESGLLIRLLCKNVWKGIGID